MKNTSSYIVTLEVPLDRMESIAQQLEDAWSLPVIQLERPGHPNAWLELYVDDAASAEIMLRAAQNEPGIIAGSIRQESTRDWQTFWRHHFHATEIGQRLKIIPVWEKDSAGDAGGRHIIWLDPGLSFGTGDHFTTRFCLEMIDRLVDGQSITSMLDVGTGSSILAIAAAKLGSRRTAGFDNDEIALQQARENIRLNGLDGKIELSVADITQQPPEGSFDLVCANVYTTILISMADALIGCTKKSLVLSGIRDPELDDVANAFTRRGMIETYRDGNGEWGGLAFAKPS